MADTDTVGHIVVFGNEKGGCGKSTAAMHTVVGLLRLGYRVGTIDLDARQGTFSRYIANRYRTRLAADRSQPIPRHVAIPVSHAATLEERKAEETGKFFAALEDLTRDNDFVVVDTPGADSHLNRLAHRFADTLVTPVNDSFIDLDLLAQFDPDNGNLQAPSVYARHVMAVREGRKKELNMGFRWIVMRNRMSPHNLKSKRDIGAILADLGARMGFTYVPGFTERLIFREMFLKGLTLLDLPGGESGKGLSPSQLAARAEIRHLIHAVVPEDMRIALVRRKKAASGTA
ncbi:MAG: AAA family ATPase [Rhodospirillales bacterium]|nr:AAA family ATPase [Alphaproteobacteria bacterium]MCB9987077.1 AAA family ATPase [Rhodospirillales bacterium]USO08160.1 MAG: AAA family ATPase [Rhodospirillales bacterium]